MADASIIVRIVDQTRGGLGSVVSQVDSLEGSANRATKGVGGLSSALGAVAAAISIKALVDFGDNVQNIQNRLALVDPALGSAADNFQRVLDIANATYQPLDAVAGLYQKVANAADQYGLSANEVSTVTQTFTNLLRLAGADAGTAAGAITQFAQALGSGTLRGDELNSVIEATAGEILPVLAKELGVSAGEVRKLAAEGKITGDILLNSLAAAAEEVGARTGQMGVTIGGALTTLQNNFLALGTQATPVFDAIAQGILLVANNLDLIVAAAATFFTAFAVVKIYEIGVAFVAIAAQAGAFLLALAPAVIGGITTAIGLLRNGILLLNASMLVNPVALAIAAISAAVLLTITYWDDFKAVAVSAFEGIVIAGLKLDKWFLEFGQNTINGVVNLMNNFGIRTLSVLKGIAAAALDPLNAFEAFREEIRKGEEQIKNNQIVVVDWSEKINALDAQIKEATTSTDSNTVSTEDNADAIVDNTGATVDNANATDDLASSTGRAEQQARLQERAQENLRIAYENATRAIDENIRSYDNETYALGIQEDQRDQINRLIELENDFRKSLGDTVAQLSAEEIRAIYEAADAENIAHLDFMKISDEKISEIYAQVEARRTAEAETSRIRDAAAAAERESTRKTAEAKREQERITSDFTRDTERQIQTYYEATTSKSKQLEDEKQEYIRRARSLGLENAKSTQDAILSYNKQVNDQIVKDHEDMIRDQERQLSDFRSEYSGIYDDIYDKLSDWTGKSKSELEKYSQYAQLFLGVNPLNAVMGFVDQGLMGISGFNTGAQATIGQTGQFIGNNVFGPNGTAAGGIQGFVGMAMNAFGANGGGLLGAVLALFGGLGGGLQGVFGDVFGFIGNGIKGIGGFLGNVWSGVKNVGSNILSGIGNAISGFFDFLFADGGYIKPGSVGIVGEAGPEFVSGPATVTSAKDSAGIMGGMGNNVNVNFSINAIDAKGIDQLLVERKPLIANIVRDAISSSGRRY